MACSVPPTSLNSTWSWRRSWVPRSDFSSRSRLISAQIISRSRISGLQQCTFAALEAITFHRTGPDDMSRRGAATNYSCKVDRVTEVYYVVQRMGMTVTAASHCGCGHSSGALSHGAILRPTIEVCVCMDGSCSFPVCLSVDSASVMKIESCIIRHKYDAINLKSRGQTCWTS